MARPLISDALWNVIEPLLPKRPPRPKGGRPPGARAARTDPAGIGAAFRSPPRHRTIPWHFASHSSKFPRGPVTELSGPLF